MASFVAQHHGPLLEKGGMVSSFLALRTRLRPCEDAGEEVAAAYPAAACGGGADRGLDDVFPDDFSVEDLLDLEGICEVHKDCAVLGDDAAPEPLLGTAAREDKVSGDSHVSSSVVSYDQMIDLPLPEHDAEELEWVTRITDDTLAELPQHPKLPAAAFDAVASRPLEGAAAASCHAMPVKAALVRVKAKRSNRSRASVWSATSSASTTTTKPCCTPASAYLSPQMFRPAPSWSPLFLYSPHNFLHEDTPRPAKKKAKHFAHGGNSDGDPKKRGSKPTKRPRRPNQFAGGAGAGSSATVVQQGDRRCSHCGLQKTPQWRAGPEGPKTLCNACGVRYKSGRLLPEYRPACSPTFVSTIHSNFHRKVLEIRRQKEDVHGPVPPDARPGIGPCVASF